MLKLHGFQVSNYYNMAKFALLEKGLKFEHIESMPSQENDFKAKSPMGKVPCLETDKGFLTETNVILDYVEKTTPSPSLMPADPFAAAKVREVMKVLELYTGAPALW
jgi:glutathione S-transferase